MYRKNDINPYLQYLLGEAFKNVLLLLAPTVFIVVFGIANLWIGKDVGLQVFYMLLGVFVGKWLA